MSQYITPIHKFNTVLLIIDLFQCSSLLVNSTKDHVVSGLDTLDSALFGGIPCDSITEIVSARGMGKTNFVFTLCMQTMFHHPDSSVIFLDTDNFFSATRLGEIGMSRFDQNEKKVISALQSIIRIQVSDVKQFHSTLKDMERIIVEKKVKLIILDSLASLIQREFGSKQNIQRHDVLSSESQLMKYIAEQFNIPFVVTNQLIGSVGNPSDSIPMLGNTWAHCVNTRLRLESNLENRFLLIDKSPVSKNLAIPYKITEAGFVDDSRDDKEDVIEYDDELGIDLAKLQDDVFY